MLKEPDRVVKETYGNRVRIRACGIFILSNTILLVNHAVNGGDSSFWNPPGGGIQFGETASEAVKREFKEETGLKAEVGEMLFINEFIEPPLHAVEIFFNIISAEGKLKTGIDPEFSEHNQIIKEVKFLTMEEIKDFPESHVHSILKGIGSFDDVLSLKGYISVY